MQLLILCLTSFYYHLFRVDVSVSETILQRAQCRLIYSDLCSLSVKRVKDFVVECHFLQLFIICKVQKALLLMTPK